METKEATIEEQLVSILENVENTRQSVHTAYLILHSNLLDALKKIEKLEEQQIVFQENLKYVGKITFLKPVAEPVSWKGTLMQNYEIMTHLQPNTLYEAFYPANKFNVGDVVSFMVEGHKMRTMNLHSN